MSEPNVPESIPPHDIEAEMGVLGCMLLNPDAVLLARERLVKSYFYNLSHQSIFEVVLEMMDQHNTNDIVRIRDELERRKLLDKIGGAVYLAELADSVANPANAEFYMELVREHAIRRRLMEASQGILRNAQDKSREVGDLLDEAEKQILAIQQQRSFKDTDYIDDVLRELVAKLEYIHQHPGEYTGLPTGYYELDKKMGGLQPGEMIVIAARPSVGKTTLALNILHHICVVEQQPALFCSLEMRSIQVVSNFLCLHARLDSHALRTGELDEQQYQDLEMAMGELQGIPMFIDDAPGMTVLDVRSRARKMLTEKGIKVVIVDYLQLITPVRPRDSRPTEVAEISHGLKSLARELNIPVIAIAQLRREAEDREPRMNDLRESGAIEQDADVILLLHRERTYSEEDTPMSAYEATEADLFLAKQRNGPTGKIKLSFTAHCFRFDSPAH